MNSNPEVDARMVWQEQPLENASIPVDDIRVKAERLTAKSRHWRLVLGPLFILLVALEAWQVWTGTELVERAGDLLTIAALLYVVHRFRRQYRAVAPSALGATSSLEFYRAALVRQRDLSRDNWGYVLPFVPGVSLSLFGGIGERTATQAILLAALGVALFAGVTLWNARTARRLQAEIEKLLDS